MNQHNKFIDFKNITNHEIDLRQLAENHSERGKKKKLNVDILSASCLIFAPD